MRLFAELLAMEYVGNIRKMKGEPLTPVRYKLPLFDVLEPAEDVAMNALIGQPIRLTFEGDIHCVITGKKIKKTYGDGMSYDAFMASPQAAPSIIRPELSRIHEGIALRDKDWEEAHHNQPHIVYLSRTSSIKVGVTRTTNVPYRWIDQGATEAITFAEVPYRQLAGLIEVAMKDFLTDKTAWQRMLKNEVLDDTDLLEKKEELLEELPEEFEAFISENDAITALDYPVLDYPKKVTSVKLDKLPVVEGTLVGIRGQYLIFGDGRVMNLRSHSGYRVRLEA